MLVVVGFAWAWAFFLLVQQLLTVCIPKLKCHKFKLKRRIPNWHLKKKVDYVITNYNTNRIGTDRYVRRMFNMLIAAKFRLSYCRFILQWKRHYTIHLMWTRCSHVRKPHCWILPFQLQVYISSEKILSEYYILLGRSNSSNSLKIKTLENMFLKLNLLKKIIFYWFYIRFRNNTLI